jgi:hypothetical protein
MWLVDHNKAMAGPPFPDSINGCFNLTGMMAIIINKEKTAIVNTEAAMDFEAPADTLEITQPFLDTLIGYIFITGNGYRGQCIQNIVATREVECDSNVFLVT